MRAAIVAFAIGVWCLQQQARLPVWTWVLAGGLLGGALFYASLKSARIGRKWPARLMLCMGCLLIGFLYASGRAQVRMDDALATHWEGQDVTLVAWIDDLPASLEYGERFNVSVEEAPLGIPRRLSLSAYARSGAAPLTWLPGQRWRLTVRLRQPHGNANPHGFDYEAWLLQQGIRATGTVRPNPVLLDDFVWRPAALVHRARYALRTTLEAALQGRRYGGVIVALVIGEQRAISAADWQIFNRTGISHLVSISGLHITLVAGVLAWLAFGLWRRARWNGTPWALRVPAQSVAALAGALTALVYCLLAGWGVPAQRTFFMLLVLALALWLQRLSAPSFVLCWALFAVIVIDPWAVLAPGFWLSFSAVALIFYVNAGRTVLQPNRWTACKEAARIQWAVTLGLAPLTLLLFQQVSIAGPVANAIAIPVVSFVVTPLALLGSLASLCGLDTLLIWAHAVFEWLMVGLRWMSDWPFAQWVSAAPPTWAFAMAMVGAIWILAPPAVPGRLLGLGWMLPMMFPPIEQPASDALWITALDVGQGSAVLVEGGGRRLLYDTGPRLGTESDAGQRVILPYLRGRGIRRLDGLIVSHNDNDHVGGAQSILDALPVDWIASSLPGTHPLRSAPNALACYAGQTWRWGEVRFEMLHPSQESAADTTIPDNARSCVLKISLGKSTVLLAGDIEKKQEAALVASAAALKADVLLVPHHGSATSSTEAFLDAVQPRHAIVQAGYRNRFGHPKPVVLARYAARSIPVTRTDESGALTYRFQADGSFRWSAYRRSYVRYWHDQQK